jgi:ABC-type transport system involved in multi-copper enzyme maturation permease subunit
LNILLLNIIAASVGIISIECVKMGNYNIKSYFVLTFYTLLLNFLFGSIGLFVSTLIKRPKPITTFSIAIVLILYFTYTISRITESADKRQRIRTKLWNRFLACFLFYWRFFNIDNHFLFYL